MIYELRFPSYWHALFCERVSKYGISIRACQKGLTNKMDIWFRLDLRRECNWLQFLIWCMTVTKIQKKWKKKACIFWHPIGFGAVQFACFLQAESLINGVIMRRFYTSIKCLCEGNASSLGRACQKVLEYSTVFSLHVHQFPLKSCNVQSTELVEYRGPLTKMPSTIKLTFCSAPKGFRLGH